MSTLDEKLRNALKRRGLNLPSNVAAERINSRRNTNKRALRIAIQCRKDNVEP